jgi:pyrroloquinoline quinone (PQQ) biosynthesis protein C
MSLTDNATSRRTEVISTASSAETALQEFWARAAMSKLHAKFAVAKEMDALPRLSIQALRAITLQYRYSTQAFVADLALLVARCPEGRLRSLLGRLVDEELGDGDPEEAHLRLYDRFLDSIGAIDRGASARQLRDGVHPKVRELLAQLRDRTLHRSPFYAIGMRGMGGECVCGVYFSVMHGHLREHPFILENDSRIDWKFWDIHAGHADVEHNELVRAAVAELLREHEDEGAVQEVSEGYEFGTAMWDAFWTTVYADHVLQPV